MYKRMDLPLERRSFHTKYIGGAIPGVDIFQTRKKHEKYIFEIVIELVTANNIPRGC